jgi:hypothetical protein
MAAFPGDRPKGPQSPNLKTVDLKERKKYIYNKS